MTIKKLSLYTELKTHTHQVVKIAPVGIINLYAEDFHIATVNKKHLN